MLRHGVPSRRKYRGSLIAVEIADLHIGESDYLPAAWRHLEICMCQRIRNRILIMSAFAYCDGIRRARTVGEERHLLEQIHKHVDQVGNLSLGTCQELGEVLGDGLVAYRPLQIDDE